MDTVAIGVSAGEKCGVTSRGVSVSVIVVAIGEICATVEQESKSTFAELISKAFQVVAAKLVNDDDDDQLGTRVVGGAKAYRRDAQQQSDRNRAQQESHRRVVYSLEQAGPNRLNNLVSRGGGCDRAMLKTVGKKCASLSRRAS